MKVKRKQVISTKQLYKRIGEEVRVARTNNGLSQRQLGICIGASRQAITAIEAGANSILAQDLLLIYHVLGLKVDGLKATLGVNNATAYVVSKLRNTKKAA